VSARVATLCPEECRYDRVGYELSCHGPSITTVPLFPLTDVRDFELYENHITLI
jgi:hypothetical protein